MSRASVCLQTIASVSQALLTICIDQPLCGDQLWLARSTSPTFPISVTSYIPMLESNYTSGYADNYLNLAAYSYYYRLVNSCGEVVSNTLIVSLLITAEQIGIVYQTA